MPIFYDIIIKVDLFWFTCFLEVLEILLEELAGTFIVSSELALLLLPVRLITSEAPPVLSVTLFINLKD